jgi:hypothetical protein
MNENSGWFVSAVGLIIAYLPDPATILVFVSIGVGLLQGCVLIKKLFKKSDKKG